MNREDYNTYDNELDTDIVDDTLFHENNYECWRKKRINATLDYFGKDFFKNKSLLEIGGNHGYVANYFSSIGSKCTVGDSYEIHNKIAKEKFPHLTVVNHDADSIEWPYNNEKFDIIIHWGLLYHLENPNTHLNEICKRCDTLVLETDVIDSTKSFYTNVNEDYQWNEGAWGSAYNKIGSKPSIGLIENILKKNKFKYDVPVNLNSVNFGSWVYDWPIKNDGNFKPGQRMIWFAYKDK